ncbi:hypothetical protein MK079_05610 [Candidatus Gracilibacteria bacterium]|nr:hypothetical protein [Candidatus Gracilibacteria bacterium]
MKNNTCSKSAVSLLEVMVTITLFMVGLVSVYSVVSSTLRLNEYNKNFIIASQLAREQMEMVSHIRDYNFVNIRNWKALDASGSNFWQTGNYYTVQNTPGYFLDLDIQQIPDFAEGESYLTTNMASYKMCLNSENKYRYDCETDVTPGFYRYLFVDEVRDEFGNREPDALKFVSRVIWYKGGYEQTDISLILTDWQRR